MVPKLQTKTKEELVGELVETQRRLGELEEADRRNQQAAASLTESAKLFRTIADNAVDAIISGDNEGKITYWNKAAEAIFGYDKNEIINQPIEKLIPQMYRQAHKKGLRRVVETGKTKIVGKTMNIAGLRRDGEEFPLELSLSMAPAREGPVFTVVARDISERHEAAKALKENEKKYSDLVNKLQEGIWVIDADANTTFVNPRMAEMLGYGADKMIGRSAISFLDDEGAEIFKQKFERRKKDISEEYDLKLPRRDGSYIYVHLNTGPLTDENGNFVGASAAIMDITERKKMEDKLSKNEKQLAEAQRIAHLGYWDWDIVSNELYWSDEVYRIFSLSPAEFGVTYEAFISTIHPDDVDQVQEALRRALEEGAPYRIDHRIVLTDGSVRFVHEQGEVFFENEKPVRMLGTVLDITEIRRAQDELLRVSRQNEQLLNSTGEGIYGIDMEGNATFVNPAALQLTGYGQEEVIGVNSHTLWHHTRPDGSSYPIEECPIYATYTDGSPRCIDNEVFWRKDGSSFPVEYNVRAIVDKGKQVGTVVSFQDITRRRKAEEETQRLNRALQTLSKANEVLIRAEDEEELLDNVCRIIVDVGCYGLTWVGYAEDDAEKSVRVVAHAGGDAAFIKELRPSWADNEFGQNPAGFAIREGQPKFIAHDDISRPAGGWKAAAADCGYAECLALPLVVDAAVSGALCICSTEAGIFTRGETRLLAELADDLAFGISSLRTRSERERAEKELKLNLERIKKITAGMTQALATAAEVRDPYTAGHQQRVTDLAVAIARELRLTDDQIDFIRTGGTLHDVGKISVPAEILTNPRKLTTLELGMVKEHSQYSYEILKEAEFPWPVADLVAQHHERLDGSGYPKGLKGDEIMLEAKILAVADVVEAMSSHRPYRPALGIEAAMEEISKKRGKLYDQEVVDACLKLLKEKKFSFKGVT